MSLPLTIREHLQHWEDPGLLFYFNSKRYKTLLVQRKDIVLLSEFLLSKLETVVDLWNLDDEAIPFPFNRPQIFAAPALLRMFQFFWRSKYVLLDKYKKPISTFWQNHGNQRIARSVYCVQVTSDPPMIQLPGPNNCGSRFFTVVKTNGSCIRTSK